VTRQVLGAELVELLRTGHGLFSSRGAMLVTTKKAGIVAGLVTWRRVMRAAIRCVSASP